MAYNRIFDVIIIGGSYSGLAAAMSLGRAVRNVLVIDSGLPCNRQTPHSHNFLTQDGRTPKQISTLAKEQVAQYPTVKFHNGLATSGRKIETGFEITTKTGDTFAAKKLLFATGLKDIMPEIPGFAECWGISIIHCPYCHGYEVRNEKTGIFGNGDAGFHHAQLISHWTKDLMIFTNGKPTFTTEQLAKIEKNNINIIEMEVKQIEHEKGQITNVVLKDGSKISLKAMYTRPKFIQHSDIPAALGCEMTEHGLLTVDAFQRTSMPGVYASGDNCAMRIVSVAVATGTMAGAAINNDMIAEEF
ncbi:MAG TPA: NAD(P)/FAD-dependent oxidoreductase [Patescibacteria group bacterium]|nr:NAD(P)/FAD-dependent oxidoreductase [Patescibacteria group bacterium]